MKGNFEALTHSEQLVLIDFYAEWCGPCKAQGPILKDVATTIGDKARIIKIDIDKNEAIANRYKIMSVPTLLLFKNGEIVWRNSGVSNKADLISVIENNA